VTVKTSLIKIGNSRGVRIPKPYLQECGLEDEIVMEVREGSIVISPKKSSRTGWEKQFGKMAQNGDDQLLDGGDPETDWERNDWEWK
jgi:antitoxin MazE